MQRHKGATYLSVFRTNSELPEKVLSPGATLQRCPMRYLASRTANVLARSLRPSVT
jgi:hypothetical protein